MGLFDIFKPKGDTIKGALEGVGNAVVRVRSGLTGKADPDTVLAVEREMNGIERDLALAQVELQKAEAGHSSVFVAGARPAILWVAATSLALFYIPQYLIGSYAYLLSCLASIEAAMPLPAYPVSADGILELVGGMFGLAVLRTVEKRDGVQGRH